MRIECLRKSLLSNLQGLVPVVPSRSVIPAYECFKVRSDGERKISVIARSLSHGIVRKIAVETCTIGVGLWPALRIVEILRKSNSALVVIETSDSEISVTTSEGKIRIPTFSADRYADDDFVDTKKVFTVSGSDVAYAYKRMSFAVREDKNDVLSCLSIGHHANDPSKLVSFVGTDGKRLTMVDTAGKMGSRTLERPMAVPIESMRLVATGVDDEDNVDFSVTDNESALHVSFGETTVKTQLHSSKYPPTIQMVPKAKPDTTLEVNVGEFLSVCSLASLMADLECRRIKFSFLPGYVSLESRGSTTGTSALTLNADVKGAIESIDLDPTYLTEYLRSLDSASKIRIDVRGPNRPVVFSDESHIHLMVPLVKGQ